MANSHFRWTQNELAWRALAEDPAELYAVVPQLLQTHYAVSGGGYYARSGDRMTLTAQWGPGKKVFGFHKHDCFALRPIRIWVSGDGDRCRHHEMANSHVCMPLVGSMDVRGLLVIDGNHGSNLDALTSFVDCFGAALETAHRCRELRHLATHDRKLGIFNKYQFEMAFESTLSRAAFDCKTVALLFIDLDHFKDYNDNFGHLAGDMLLESVAGVLRSVLRGSDFPARWGGEELVLVLVGTDVETAAKRAEELLCRIKTLPQVPNHHPVTASIGIAMFPRDGRTTTELVAAADSAAYRAKHNGRNRVELANENEYSRLGEHSYSCERHLEELC
jgi:diguanylate cyclase (GGDEF)-like protein